MSDAVIDEAEAAKIEAALIQVQVAIGELAARVTTLEERIRQEKAA